MSMAQTDTPVEEKTIQVTKEPGKYAVIFLNDEKTPMDFVIQALIKHFQYNKEQANKMTETIHNEGKGVVALYNFEIAEQKATEVKVDAVQHGYPLEVKVENA
jgi:ATP-dependent Clp protease adaptor protein ClpS|tara:strand:- start:4 stop:312 length:309 start_codon:yes stop_codon:yes gene_type:complete